MSEIDILKSRYPEELVENLLQSFIDIEKNYRLENWKTSELDSGHFVEIVRRIIENELFGTYTPIDQSLSSFHQGELNRYESSSGDESFRMIIPRVLYAIYCVRNKRGVGHVSSISPNKMDATYIINSVKWTLAELIRIAGQSQPAESIKIIDQIIDRHVDIIWEDGTTFMILDPKMAANDKALLTLYKSDNLSIDELRKKVGYKNKTNFKKIIERLEKDCLIAVSEVNTCKLSPLGSKKVEEEIIDA